MKRKEIKTMDLACVYVVEEHLGFYTDPTITEMQEGEELNDFMWRVLTEEWLWDRDYIKSMYEAGKIRCFKLNSMLPKVWGVISSFMHDSNCRHLITSREHSELHVKICEVLKIVEEPMRVPIGQTNEPTKPKKDHEEY